jgi:hypothetical protein
VGIRNFQGANDIFNELKELVADYRQDFYDTLASTMTKIELIMLKKENPFLDWD